MQIEEGKSYKTRDGEKASTARRDRVGDYQAWILSVGDVSRRYDSDGTWDHGETSKYDLIAEWKEEPTGPVTIETVKRINTGTFKRVHVTPINDDFVSLHLQGQTFNATELRDISELAAQLADALEGK